MDTHTPVEDEEMLRGLFEFAPDPIFVVRGDGKIIRANREAERIFGYTREELLNQPIEILIPERYKGHHVSDREAYAASPHTRSMGSAMNFRARHKDGREFPVDVMLSPMASASGRVTIAIVRDITEQKKLQEAIMYVSEKEKLRIGLEIHDDLCQSLVAVTLLSNALHESLARKNLAEQEDAKQIVELLAEVNAHAREMARGLVAINFQGGAFSTAVENLASRVTRVSKIECSAEVDGALDFPEHNIAKHLYRIIQQAISNAVLHSGASRIGIRVTANEQLISITVEDNGSGIPDPPVRTNGMGLMTMQYRAQLIKASLNIKRRDRGGTEVVCSLPR